MLVGYMRVSSDNDRQTTALQRDALIAAGVDTRHLFEDKASGARDDRPGLKRCLDFLKAGDTLVVWKLDRLGRSLPHLLDIVTCLRGGGIAFRSLTADSDEVGHLFQSEAGRHSDTKSATQKEPFWVMG
jgi:DNA invertase Pin-like site-specific DNA recombinase